MRAVRSPVIVFASAGDNITPPGQALRWIADVYRDEREIKTLGQTIVYLMHEDIGHLGIFVSGAVALKEHTEIAETLQLIESVAPGLYDAPTVRLMATEQTAERRRQMNPMRLRRTLLSDHNPAMAPVPALAEAARAHRRPAAPTNTFLAWERLWAEGVERSFDLYRDLRDGWTEYAFHAVYGALGTWGVAGASPAATRRRKRRPWPPRCRRRRSGPPSPASPKAAMPRRSSA